jgi:hypothetical protein
MARPRQANIVANIARLGRFLYIVHTAVKGSRVCPAKLPTCPAKLAQGLGRRGQPRPPRLPAALRDIVDKHRPRPQVWPLPAQHRTAQRPHRRGRPFARRPRCRSAVLRRGTRSISREPSRRSLLSMCRTSTPRLPTDTLASGMPYPPSAGDIE